MTPSLRRVAVFAALAARLVSSPVNHAQSAAPAASAIPRIDYEKYSLPNGLEVILSQDHRLPLTAVNLWYHVGPANEEPGRTGFAHLFEHMMFQGSKHVASDAHFRILEGAGASDINGTTDFDRTNYFETIPASQLELALWIESDRMGYLLEKVDQGALDNQQDVVRNERRQSVENQPYGIAEEAMFHQLFPKTHPYYAEVIGSHADIQAARLEDVQKFFKQYYSPSNASLAIVGDIDTAATKKLVERYFGPLERGPDVPPITAATPPIEAERRQTVADRVELPRVYMAWITSPFFKPGDADADIAAGIIGGGKSSRLYKRLVYDKQIAQQVSAQQYSLVLGSVFNIQVTARPGHTADEIEAALEAELDAFRGDGPDVQEVERARNAVETRIVEGLETLGGFGGVADRLNMYNHFLRNPGYLQNDVARYRAVTPASVRRFVQEQLKKRARVVVHAVPGAQDLGPPAATPPPAKAPPGQGAQSINADAPWRTQMPVPAPSRPLTLPVPQTFRLPNGLTVLYTERPGLPIVSASLIMRSGGDINPLDRPGLADFTAAMLTEGTTTRSALQIADESAQLGAALSTASTMDSSRVTLKALEHNFAPALELMADLVLRPSFPPEEIERQRKSRLGSLAQQRDDPFAVAGTVMAAALYGNRHPYGFTEIGTEQSIQAMSRGELTAFWKQNFVPNNAALVVAGRITRSALEPLVARAFGAWQRGTPAKPPAATLAAAVPARVIIVDKPGAPQSQLRVATIGADRSTPEYPQLQVLNEIVGGLFSSRINMNLREEHGYTYGAFSRFVYRRAPGPFYISAGVRTDVTAPSVGEIMKEVKRMNDAPVTSDELKLARESIVRSLPANFETSAGAVSVFSSLYVYDLGLDYYARFPETVTAVGRESVQTAARKYLVPGKLIVVIVGDRAKIEPELLKLNLGRLEYRDADGVVK